MPRDLETENHTSAPYQVERSPARREMPDTERRQAPPPKRHLVRNIVIILVICALVAGAVIRILQTRQAAAQKQSTGGRGGGGGFPVPVVAGTVEQKDVPIYLDGLGTIQALNTVTVHTRVDGEIMKIAFTEGQDVKEGELLAKIDPAPFEATLEQAQAKQRTDQAMLTNARVDMERDQDMITKKVISQQQYDTQKALVNQLEATVQNDQAAVTSAKVNLDYTAITAPFSGRTGIRLIDQGNIVHAADTTGIVVLTQVKPISLIFTLPEQDLVKIHQQQEQTPELEVVAVARDNSTKLGEGKLTVIDNQIDITTGTIKLKAEFPNEHNQLWPGQFVNARLLLKTQKDGIVVPASVIQRGPDSSYAYVIVENAADPAAGPKVEMRPVKVTQIDQGDALVADGLKAGERVVVDGQYKLQPNSRVKIGSPPAHSGEANPGGHAGPKRGGGQAGGQAGAPPKNQ